MYVRTQMVTTLVNADDNAYLMPPELLHGERHACKAFWRRTNGGASAANGGALSLDSRDRAGAGAVRGIRRRCRRRFTRVRKSDAMELMGLAAVRAGSCYVAPIFRAGWWCLASIMCHVIARVYIYLMSAAFVEDGRYRLKGTACDRLKC